MTIQSRGEIAKLNTSISLGAEELKYNMIYTNSKTLQKLAYNPHILSEQDRITIKTKLIHRWPF
jgi:hypothetical protein